MSITFRRKRSVPDPAHAELRQRVRGPVLDASSEGYDDARRLWNAMVDKRPRFIVRCTQVSDVQAALEVARTHRLPVSVRGGGHNIAGIALTDGGVVLDMSLLKAATVDPASRTVVAEAGLTWGEFDRATQAFGLATTGGAVSTTGIAGLTLGGGLGWLMGRCGYAVDNVLAAEVVLASGDVVHVDKDTYPDLFWALRGGGANFGVVTTFTYRLHQVEQVWAGLIAHPLHRLGDLLRFYRDLVAEAPDELTVHLAVIGLPTIGPVGALLPVWSGPVEQGRTHITALRRFGTPLIDTVDVVPYVTAQTMLDAAAPHGRHNYWKSSFLADVPVDAAPLLTAHARSATSPYSLCLFEHVHGEAARIPVEAAAFCARGEQFHFIASAAWEGGAPGPHVSWARRCWADVQGRSPRPAYMNLLAADESDRIREAYGPSYDRLAAVKARYDPTNVFRGNHNIPPRS